MANRKNVSLLLLLSTFLIFAGANVRPVASTEVTYMDEPGICNWSSDKSGDSGKGSCDLPAAGGDPREAAAATPHAAGADGGADVAMPTEPVPASHTDYLSADARVTQLLETAPSDSQTLHNDAGHDAVTSIGTSALVADTTTNEDGAGAPANRSVTPDTSSTAAPALVDAVGPAGTADSAAPADSVAPDAAAIHAPPPIASAVEDASAITDAPPAAAPGPEVTAAEVSAVPPNELDELRGLLTQARQAVGLLEGAVTNLEQRLAVATAATAGGAVVSSVDPIAALLRSLGLDPAGTSTAARSALREALNLVLREQGGRAGAVAVGAGVGKPAAARAAAGGGVAVGEWLDRHFSLRAALRVPEAPGAPPPAPPAPAAPAAVTDATVAALTPVSITCAFAYEMPHPSIAASGGGPLVYIVAGDATGTLYLLSPHDGSVLASTYTGTDSPITACAAYYNRRTDSTVVTGHANGQTRSFAVVTKEEAQAPQTDGGGGGDTAVGAAKGARQRQPSSGPLHVTVQSLAPRHVMESMPQGALPWAAVEELIAPAAAASAAAEKEGGADAPAVPAAGAPGVAEGLTAAADVGAYTGPPAPIMHLVPYKLGNKVGGRRHVMVLDRAGNLRVDRENGTVRFWARTNRTQLAVHMVGTYVVMLSAFHATVINSLQPRQPRAYSCQHLNGSRLLAASFDGHRPFRGYGVNTRGELLALVTPHEGGLTTCKAHRAIPLPWLDPETLPATAHSLSLTPMRGYLIMTHGSNRVVFNVTGVVRQGLPFVASIHDDLLAEAAVPVASSPPPPAAPTSADAAPALPVHSAWAASGGLINGLLPPPPVVAVAPGSQIVVMALPQQPHPKAAPQPLEPAAPAEGGERADAASISYTATHTAVDSVSAADGAPADGAAGALLVLLDSKMPRTALPGPPSKIWSQPVFLGAMFLVGLYQFWRLTNNRSQRRTMAAGARGVRARRGPGGGYGGGYGDAGSYMYGDNRAPLQPRSSLRRGRGSDRPIGRTVTYEDDDY